MNKERKYVFKKGRKNNRKPLPHKLQFLPMPWKGFECTMRFAPSSWWPDAPDQWNKGFGLTSAFNLNERSAAIAAFKQSRRYDNVMEIAGYTNDAEGGFDWGDNKDREKFIYLPADGISTVYVRGEIYGVDGRRFMEKALGAFFCTPAYSPQWYVHYELSYDGQHFEYIHPFDAPRIQSYRLIDPYFGGRVPPAHDFVMWGSFNLFR
jgi:hypothetical protein